jgi:hypothetical protein
MDKILLISSAAMGFVFGAFYAAAAKVFKQAVKAMITANQKAENANSNGRDHDEDENASAKAPEKVKLPARIK